MRRGNIFIITGIVCLGIAGAIFFLIFSPVLQEEVNYRTRSSHPTKPFSPTEIQPLDPQFGIIIPKLGANARIIANVDPYDSRLYQTALTKGVAHAKGTVFPGQIGNVFLFAHSSVNFYEAMRYNAVFYLVTKLEKGDEIILYYQGTPYRYRITHKELVDASAISYLTRQATEKQVTLMTCWPPGTTFKRLVVTGLIAPL